MNKKKCCQVDSHLQCKSTASLDNQIAGELCKEDRSLAELLDEEETKPLATPEDQQDAQE